MLFHSHGVRTIALLAGLALLNLSAAGLAQTTGAPPVIPENATALEGQPTVRVDATKEGATRRELDKAEAARQSLKVSVAKGRYYWTSRDNRPLTLTTSGEFIYLSTDPGRYVRIRKINDRFSYVEHVDTEFGSVTFWGELRVVLRK
jgi:hypothetical protein